MNFTITWIMDRLGFVPKVSVDLQEWPFPVKKAVKIPKATTRKKPVNKK